MGKVWKYAWLAIQDYLFFCTHRNSSSITIKQIEIAYLCGQKLFAIRIKGENSAFRELSRTDLSVICNNKA